MLELYQREECSYCVKVRQFLSDHCIDYIAHSAGQCAHQREELQKRGGKLQVPFLYDAKNDIHMYESDDIIEYLKKHYVKK